MSRTENEELGTKNGERRLAPRAPAPRSTFYLLCSVFGTATLVLFLAACSPPGRVGQPPRPAVNPPAAARPVLAEAVCDAPRVRVQVTEIVRTGAEAVSITFRLSNPDKTSPVSIGDAFADVPGDAGSLSGIYVVDEERRKKLFVLRDGQEQPQCSTGLGDIAPGGAVEGWGRYPMPGFGAARLTVQVPRLPAFRDLPITEPPARSGASGARRD